MNDVECPYCGAEQEICHDDGYGMEENQHHEQECTACDRTFCYTTAIVLLHTAARADCLNGAPHRYRPTTTFPPEHTKMECQDCKYRRPCTEQELSAVLQAEYGE